jgi:hypothetical protein
MSTDDAPNVVRLDKARAVRGKGPAITPLAYRVTVLPDAHVRIEVQIAPDRIHTWTVTAAEAAGFADTLRKGASRAQDQARKLRGADRYACEPGDRPGTIYVRHDDKRLRWRLVTIRVRTTCRQCWEKIDPPAQIYEQAELADQWDSKSGMHWQRLCLACVGPAHVGSGKL